MAEATVAEPIQGDLIVAPRPAEIESVKQEFGQASLILSRAMSLTVGNNEDNAAAGQELGIIKALAKTLDAKRKSLTAPLDESKKRIMDMFRGPLEDLQRAEGRIKNVMLAFAREQEVIRQAEEDRLRKIQEAEAAKIEKARGEAEEMAATARREAAEKEEAARRAKEAGDAASAAKAQAEANALAKQAEKAEARSEALDEKKMAVEMRPVAVAPTVEKVAGSSTRDNWTFQITDESKLPREFLIPDTAKIGKYTKAMKSTGAIPGVRIYNEPIMATRAAR